MCVCVRTTDNPRHACLPTYLPEHKHGRYITFLLPSHMYCTIQLHEVAGMYIQHTGQGRYISRGTQGYPCPRYFFLVYFCETVTGGASALKFRWVSIFLSFYLSIYLGRLVETRQVRRGARYSLQRERERLCKIIGTVSIKPYT